MINNITQDKFIKKNSSILAFALLLAIACISSTISYADEPLHPDNPTLGACQQLTTVVVPPSQVEMVDSCTQTGLTEPCNHKFVLKGWCSKSDDTSRGVIIRCQTPTGESSTPCVNGQEVYFY